MNLLKKLQTYSSRYLKADRWFPHLPLAVGVGLLGLLQFIPALQTALGLPDYDKSLAGQLSSFWEAAVQGVPQGVMGVFLVIVSFGLAFRSRLAWVVSVFILMGMLTLEFLPQTGDTAPILSAYNCLLLFFLLISFSVFKRKTIGTATLFATTLILMLLAYSVIGTFIIGQDFSPPIDNLVTALYFCIVTMTTVGYGQFTPQTQDARLFVISMIVLGIIVFGTALSAILIPVLSKRLQNLIKPRGKKMERCNHYIIIGNTALTRNVFQELMNRDQKVTVILEKEPSENSPLSQADMVLGDGSDLEVLKEAGANHSKAILALGENDSENAFMIMAAKELDHTPQTVTVVNESKNHHRLKRVKPDLILAPQVLGGEILAMTLMGESLDQETLTNKLLNFQPES